MRKTFILILTFLFLYIPLVSASEQSISTTGMYIAGASESLNDAKQNALNDALRRAAEQAGVLVNSYSKTHNMELTEDEVSIIASNIIKVTQKKFDVKLLSDSEIKVIAYIDVVVDTNNINEDIMNLKEKNKHLEKENISIKKEKDVLDAVKNLSEEIRNSYRNTFSPISGIPQLYKLTPSSPWRYAVHNFYIHMQQGNYYDVGGDLAIAKINYKKQKGVLKYGKDYIDDVIMDLSIKTVEYFLAKNDYLLAMNEIYYITFKVQKNSYMINSQSQKKLYRYNSILSAYIDMYELDKWHKMRERNSLPSLG